MGAQMWYNDPTMQMVLRTMGSESIKEIFGHWVAPRMIFAGRVGAMALPMILSFICDKQKAFILCDPAVEKHARSVATDFEEAGFETKIWNESAPEPPVSLVEKCSEEMTSFEPDLLIAVGGGSTIDLAKAAWILYEQPGYDLSQVNPLVPLGLRKKALLAAYPTTSGTGSEVTWASILTDDTVTPPVKMELSSMEIVPDFAVLVPEFAAGMPPRMTAGTGLDALAHAVDGYLTSYDIDISDALATKAIELVFRFLPKAYKAPNDMEARHRMHTAATMAGLAFGNTQCALTHSLGHSVGKVFNMHHGIAVGIFIPYAIQYYSKVSTKYMKLARGMDIRVKDKAKCLEKLVSKFKEFLLSFDVPYALKEHGITREDWERHLDDVTRYAFEDACTPASPRPTSPPEIKKMLEYAYEGKDIDF